MIRRIRFLKRFPKPVQGVLVGLCAGAIALFLGMFQFAADLELYTVDLRYKLRPPIKTLPTLGYIDFDDASLRLCGQWPWPRLRHTVLVNTLQFYNARAAAFDVFFVERENTVFYPATLKKFLASSGSKDENQFLRVLDDSFRNYDEEFAEAMTKYGNIYLSYYTIRAFEGVAGKSSGIVRPNAPNTGLDLLKKTFLPIPKGLNAGALYSDIHIDPPLEEFVSAAKGVGYAEPVLDSDSIVRHYTLLRRYDNYMTYPVVLKMLSNIMDFKLSEIEIVPGEHIVLKNALQYGTDMRQDVKIPIDQRCQMPLNWAGAFLKSYTHIPYELVSYFYAVIRAKQIASGYTGGSYPELYKDIYADLMEDTLVSEDNGRAIATEIAASLFISKYLDRGITQPEIYQQLKPYVNDDTIGRVYAVVTASLQIEKELKENRGGRTPAVNINESSYAPQIAEALKNMKWFYDKNRLKEAYPYYFPNAAALIKHGEPGTFSPIDMEGMIFMTGLTGTNTIDLNPTPYEPTAPMVSFHLNAINSILTGQFLHTAPNAYNRAITLALAILTAVTGVLTGVVITSAVTAAAAAAYTFLTYKLWILKGYRIDLVMPLTGLALAYITVLVTQFVRMFLERKKVRSIFAQMVSPAVLKTMEENPGSFTLTGQRKAAEVFFSSLNGMDEAIRKVSPDELPALLSIYLSPNSDIIMNYGGYIDKYEGHVIMADFGVPIDDELAAVKCAFSAIEQRLDIEAFTYYAQSAYGLAVSVSIGFNYGYVSAGNMGSEEKFQYTVMGDPVNVAARLMAANSIYNSDYAITGEDTVPVISEFVHLRLLDRLLLKGKTKPLAIYECLGWKPEAYLKFHSGKPLPVYLKDLWIKCPAPKIAGYVHLWERIYNKTAHPLAKTIWDFFTECLSVVEPLRYKKKAEEFYKKVSGNSSMWHEMMALAGAPTENGLTAGRYFREALNLYWERRWDEAIEVFQKVLQYAPNDAPARSFINRIELYKETPPPEQWQGEFIQTKK